MTVVTLDTSRARPEATGALRRRGRGRALAHACSRCGAHWSRTVVHHPTGTVVVCRACGALQSRISTVRPEPERHQAVLRALREVEHLS
jgi:ribosomal protein S27E